MRIKSTHQNRNAFPPTLQLEAPEFLDNHRLLCPPRSSWWGWALGVLGLPTTWAWPPEEGQVSVSSLLETASGKVTEPARASDTCLPFPRDQKAGCGSGSHSKPSQCLQDRATVKISRQACDPNSWFPGVIPGVAGCSASESLDPCPDRGHHRRSAELWWLLSSPVLGSREAFWITATTMVA